MLWFKQATRQTMQHVSIPLKPVGNPPPYPPPRLTRPYNEAYPSDLCAAVVLARIAFSKETKKEMEENYEKQKKYEWRTEWKDKRWTPRIARRYGEWQRRCLAKGGPGNRTGAKPCCSTSTAAFLPPQLQHLDGFWLNGSFYRSTSTNDDPEWLLAELFKATNAPR